MKSKIFLLLLLLSATCAFSQNVRWDIGNPGSAGVVTTAGSGGLQALLAQPGVQLNWCNFPANAVPCSNFANTYPSLTSTTACPTNTQIVLQGSNTCVQTSDALGNLGVYTLPGTYTYTLTVNGVPTGPYIVTVGSPSGGGGGGGGGSFVCGTTAVPGLLYWDGTHCQQDGGATFDAVNLVWNFEAIVSAGTITAAKFQSSGAGGVLELQAQSAPGTIASGKYDLYIDTVTGLVHCRNSASGDCLGAVQFVVSGSTVLTATAVTAGACNTYSSTATGATSSNAAIPSLHGVDASTISGYQPGQLEIYPPFTGTNLVSFKVCNPTAGTITPGAPLTVFWDIR